MDFNIRKEMIEKMNYYKYETEKFAKDSNAIKIVSIPIKNDVLNKHKKIIRIKMDVNVTEILKNNIISNEEIEKGMYFAISDNKIIDKDLSERDLVNRIFEIEGKKIDIVRFIF